MALYKSWSYRDIAATLDSIYVTGAQQLLPTAGIVFFMVCTHNGIGSGAKIELGDASEVKLHFESSSGDVSPFGISLARPMGFDTSIQLSATATGLKVTVGYHAILA